MQCYNMDFKNKVGHGSILDDLKLEDSAQNQIEELAMDWQIENTWKIEHIEELKKRKWKRERSPAWARI